jgi:hypothetical protein
MVAVITTLVVLVTFIVTTRAIDFAWKRSEDRRQVVS